MGGLVVISGCFKLCNNSTNEAGRPARTLAPAQLDTGYCKIGIVYLLPLATSHKDIATSSLTANYYFILNIHKYFSKLVQVAK